MFDLSVRGRSASRRHRSIKAMSMATTGALVAGVIALAVSPASAAVTSNILPALEVRVAFTPCSSWNTS